MGEFWQQGSDEKVVGLVNCVSDKATLTLFVQVKRVLEVEKARCEGVVGFEKEEDRRAFEEMV